MRSPIRWATTALSLLALAGPTLAADWFETFKDEASDDELLTLMHAMPKGGDLHHHTGGSVLAEWYLDLAVAAEADGYRYYTKTRIENCRYGSDEFGRAPYLLMFRTIAEHEWRDLPACEQAEFTPMAELNREQRTAWLDSIRLDKPHEGRSEFFEAHWMRIGALGSNPHLMAEVIARNMMAFGEENLLYLEAQVPVVGFETPDGTPISADDALDIYRARIARPDVVASGVTLRMQVTLLRFLPRAEEALRWLYAFAARHDDVVAVNFAGREDNDKGYPLRFLETLRELRHEYSGVRLSIHAGEVDEPNSHVRDTLLLGADRIGHGVNLISDPDTMLLMRHGPYMVEVNLISNLLLEYVDDYSQHPFPEYLRTGIPVALSTDDRGMWDSTISDEFFVAVKEFDLSWEELKLLSRNSLVYSFLEDDLKADRLAELERRLAAFETGFQRGGLDAVTTGPPQYRGFLCRTYAVCAPGS
ncbi:MAG TPA: hypothetical protein VLA56_09155 [Pseudomonadales bacterium]|nr:hypothetical protein [Pseudomonadales bacterium]